jgi:hypothetical protein
MICVSGKMTHEISHNSLGFDPTDDFPGHLELDSI